MSFEKIKELGKGAFGVTYLIKYKGGVAAMKEMKQQADYEKAKDECKIMSKLRHNNIVRFYEYIDNEKEKKLSIIMEYCKYGSLKCIIRGLYDKHQHLSEYGVKHYFVGMVLGLQYLHHHNILHRDLKTDNIFINADNIALIGDFGWSKETESLATTVAGTPLYMAPEILKSAYRDSKTDNYSNKIDIYSLGCILFELCANEVPYNRANGVDELVKKQKTNSYDKTIPEDLNIFMDLINRCLSYEADRRPSIDEVLNYPLLQDYINSSSSNCFFIANTDSDSSASSNTGIQPQPPQQQPINNYTYEHPNYMDNTMITHTENDNQHIQLPTQQQQQQQQLQPPPPAFQPPPPPFQPQQQQQCQQIPPYQQQQQQQQQPYSPQYQSPPPMQYQYQSPPIQPQFQQIPVQQQFQQQPATFPPNDYGGLNNNNNSGSATLPPNFNNNNNHYNYNSEGTKTLQPQQIAPSPPQQQQQQQHHQPTTYRKPMLLNAKKNPPPSQAQALQPPSQNRVISPYQQQEQPLPLAQNPVSSPPIPQQQQPYVQSPIAQQQQRQQVKQEIEKEIDDVLERLEDESIVKNERILKDILNAYISIPLNIPDVIEDKIFLIFKKISNFIGRQLLQDPFYREVHLEYYKINGYEDAKGNWERDVRVLSLLSLMIQYFDVHHREAESKVIKDALTEDGIHLS